MAEDAVQETLQLAYERLGRLHEGTSLKSFLAGIASKRARSLLRSERRRLARETHAQEPEKVASGEAVLTAARLAERIRSALRRLPEKRQAAVLLRLEGRLDDQEIAQALESTPGSIRVLVHQGLKELKAALDEDGGMT